MDTTIQALVALVAVYGAALSTYIFISERRERSKQINVTLSLGFLTFGPELSDTQLLLQAANSGHRAVTLVGWCVRTPRGEQLLMPLSNAHPSFPCELRDGQSVTCWLGAREVARALLEHNYSGTVALVGEVRDPTGAVFQSSRLKFDISDLVTSR